nr:uncharacterized protein LOC103452601 isoform X4 [Malus domestica]
MELSSRRQPHNRLSCFPESQYSICIDAATADTPKTHFQFKDSILPSPKRNRCYLLLPPPLLLLRPHKPSSSANSIHRRVGPSLSPLRPLHGFCGGFLRRYTLHSNNKHWQLQWTNYPMWCPGRCPECFLLSNSPALRSTTWPSSLPLSVADEDLRGLPEWSYRH